MGKQFIQPDMTKAKRIPARTIILLLIIAVLIIATGAAVYAKYVQNRDRNNSFRSQNFYFTSDLLTEEGAVYDLNPGTTILTITLKNKADDLRISEVDIPYTVEVTDAAGGTVTLDQTSGTLKGTLAADSSDPDGDTDEITVTIPCDVTDFKVTAKTNTTYAKTINATFHILQDGASYGYSSKQYDGYVELTVWSNGYAGNFNVMVPAGLIPDRTNPELQSMTYSESVDSSLTLTGFAAYESRKYRFFGSTLFPGTGAVIAE